MNEHLRLRSLVGLFLLVGFLGCEKPPKNLSPPPIDPAAASKAAMELFDVDQNGVIDKSELVKSPGLKAAVATTDLDGDGGLSGEEIQKRLQIYVDSKTAIRNYQIGILRNGDEPRDLDVKVVPEPFLAEYIETAKASTNTAGVASPAITFEDPELAAQGYGGIRLGMYRVEVTEPDASKKSVPKKYNQETTLGIEVGLDHHAPLPVLKLSY